MEYKTNNRNGKYRTFIHLYIIVEYACIFIIPSVSIFGEYRELQYSKLIFYGFTIVMACIVLKRMKTMDLLICILAVALTFLTKSLTPLSWISTVILCRMLEEGEGEYIKRIILTTRMNYIALAFVGVYSVLYGLRTISSNDFQLARTAIFEVNQSGLAILCLGLIIKAKHNLPGNIILCFGMLGLSRNYILALILLLIINRRFILEKLEKGYRKGLLKFTTIIFLSTFAVICIGLLYIYWWNMGEITFKTGTSRISNLKDYSNFYRFSTNITFVNMIRQNPIHLLIGYSDLEEYREGLVQSASALHIYTSGHTPHNFMLSYFRLYGISTIILVFYISKTLNHVISKYNVGIYLSICLYPIFMSAGFNTWWLYLTVFVLLVYNQNYISGKARYQIRCHLKE